MKTQSINELNGEQLASVFRRIKDHNCGQNPYFKRQSAELQTFADALMEQMNTNSVGRFLSTKFSPLANHIAGFAFHCPHIFIGMVDVVGYLRDEPMEQASGEKPPTVQQVLDAMAELGFVKIPDSVSYGDGDGQPIHMWVSCGWRQIVDIVNMFIRNYPESIGIGCLPAAVFGFHMDMSLMSAGLADQHPVGFLDPIQAAA